MPCPAHFTHPQAAKAAAHCGPHHHPFILTTTTCDVYYEIGLYDAMACLIRPQAAAAAARHEPPPGPMDAETAHDVMAYEEKVHGGAVPSHEVPGPESFGARCEHAASKGELPPAYDNIRYE